MQIDILNITIKSMPWGMPKSCKNLVKLLIIFLLFTISSHSNLVLYKTLEIRALVVILCGLQVPIGKKET